MPGPALKTLVSAIPPDQKQSYSQWRLELSVRLRRLYREHQPKPVDESYFRIHGADSWIDNRVRTFLWAVPYLPGEGARILDWGAKHGAESCLLRWRFAEAVDLHACDFYDHAWYPGFYDESRAAYRRLSDEVELPYPSGMFDVVVGSGVLEHAPLDYESLKEIRRVLKPGGRIIITYLPNLFSHSEWRRRAISKTGFHKRLYSRRGTLELFRRAGFHPHFCERQSFAVEHLFAKIGSESMGRGLNRWLSRLTPIHVTCSTLSVAAVKESVM